MPIRKRSPLPALRISLAALALLLAMAPARAEEVIQSFHSAVQILANGDLNVTETITVVSEGQQIRRGIYRDFPRHFEGPNGRTGTVRFDVTEVLRDGQREPYSISQATTYTRVYIGDPDVLLQPGVHTYRLTYTSDRQIRFFDDYDELYWNATGNAWAFTIQKATAAVYLPEGGEILDTFVYTGRYDSTAQDAMVQVADDRQSATFTANNELPPRNGMTVGVKLPKGLIPQPTQAEEVAYFLRDYRTEILGTMGLLFIALYYWFAWRLVGRDPPAGVAVPRWDTPEGVSPALARYIDKKYLGYQPWQAISAALVSLAVKGYVILDEPDGDLAIRRTDKQPVEPLPVGEAALMSWLGGQAGSFTIDKDHGKDVVRMADSFRKAIYREHRNQFYQFNVPYVVLGVVLSLMFLGLTLYANASVDFTPIAGGMVIAGAALAIVGVKAGHAFSSGGSLLGKLRLILFVSIAGWIFPRPRHSRSWDRSAMIISLRS